MTFNQLYPFRHGQANQILLNRNDSIIRWSVENFGEYSEAEVDIFRALCQDKTVVDVGANYGCHTLALASMAEHVVAIEPQLFIFQTLCANVALNSLTNVETINAACGPVCGKIQLPMLDPLAPQNFGCFAALGYTKGYPAQMVSIDSLALPNVDFIKLDIEGNELMALQGAEKTIDQCSPILYMEFTSNRQALLDWLADHHYIPIRHIPFHNREPNYLGKPIEGTEQANSGSDMLLAYREPPDLPISWLQEKQFVVPTTEDLWGPQSMRLFADWPYYA